MTKLAIEEKAALLDDIHDKLITEANGTAFFDYSEFGRWVDYLIASNYYREIHNEGSS